MTHYDDAKESFRCEHGKVRGTGKCSICEPPDHQEARQPEMTADYTQIAAIQALLHSHGAQLRKLARSPTTSQRLDVQLGAHATWLIAALARLQAVQDGTRAAWQHERDVLEAVVDDYRVKLGQRDAARARAFAAFGHNAKRGPDGECVCPYCTRDAELLAEMTAEYEMQKESALQRAIKAEADVARLQAENLSLHRSWLNADNGRKQAEIETARLQAERDEAVKLMYESAKALARQAMSGWRCFFCWANFTDETEARTHFGDHSGERAACLKINEVTMDAVVLAKALEAAEAARDEAKEVSNLLTAENNALEAVRDDLAGDAKRYAAMLAEAQRQTAALRTALDEAIRQWRGIKALMEQTHQTAEHISAKRALQRCSDDIAIILASATPTLQIAGTETTICDRANQSVCPRCGSPDGRLNPAYWFCNECRVGTNVDFHAGTEAP